LQKKKEKAETQHSKYNGEWARYEKWIFEQANKPPIFEDDEKYENIELRTLINADGENFRRRIDIIELMKIKDVDFFFPARKRGDNSSITVKKCNREKLESRINILDEADRLLKKIKAEKIQNNKLNAQIKITANSNGEKPCYKVIEEYQLDKSEQYEIKFAKFRRNDGRYNIVFDKTDEDEINRILRGPQLSM
jgi:hypothetical protein